MGALTVITPQMNHTTRQNKLAAALRKTGLEALMVTHVPNVRYLCGFTGTAGVLLLQVSGRGTHKTTFFTDGRYTQQAHQEVQSPTEVIANGPAFVELFE